MSLPPDYEELVLTVAESIPEGRALAYGDVAELIGAGGPRQVARVMSLAGAAVPWWRVVRADGTLPERLRAGAAQRYRAEGTAVGRDGRVDMRLARWRPPLGLMT